MKLSRAVDLWLGELARAGRSEGTRDAYRRHLWKFIGQLERTRPDVDVSEVSANDCRAFLDRWLGKRASTICTVHSAVNGLFQWLYLEGEVETNPMVRIRRPRRPKPGEAEVVIVTAVDVERIFAAAEDWQEFLCVAVLAYTGARRNAASRLRWQDVDLVDGRMRLREKGGKVADVPMPDELLTILRAAVESEAVACRADDYVIPNRRSASVRRAERTNKIVYETVVRVAERAGVRATAHALRRAFAVAFLTSHPGAIESLQALMNHSRVDTTQVYLRALNRSQAMDAVRDLSCSTPSVFSYQAPKAAQLQGKAHTGFEPVPPP
jgi:integrase